MKKNKYQHLIINALLSAALFHGNLNASEDQGLASEFCRHMQQRAATAEALDNIGITLIENIVRAILLPPPPPTLLERVSTAATQATKSLSSLLKNSH